MLQAVQCQHHQHRAVPTQPPLQPAPQPQAPPQDIEISYNSQDGFVSGGDKTTVHDVQVGTGLATDRAKLRGRLQPNEDGKYVFPESDKRYHTAQTFAAVARTIETFEQALGQPIKWAFRKDQLAIIPDGGEMLNAYYSRQDGFVNFFHSTDPGTDKTVWSGDSGEVVSHEAGHAILDGLRPGYFSTWSPDPAAFHEAFGDVLAMCMSLHDDRLIDKVLAETGGDLSKNNALAAMGEELGVVINNTAGKNATGGNYTRNSLNNFVWADPSTLPERGGPDQLGYESHSFSRLWTGATYDVMKGIYERNQADGMSQKDALKATGQELTSLYANLFKTAPRGDFTFREMAEALVQADRDHMGGKNADLITSVFTKRQILQADAQEVPPSSPFTFVQLPAEGNDPTRSLRITLQGADYGQFSGATVETVLDRNAEITKDAQASTRVRTSMKQLIADQRIKMTQPGQVLQTKDYFDSEGRPYTGVVRWQDGQMRIERVPIAT